MFIACDPGCNWLGDFNSLQELAWKCKEAGANGFKPQLWAADSLYQPTNPYYNIQRKCELTFNQAKNIFEYGKKIGIEVFFSVFDIERIQWCEKIGVQRYKIASRTAALKDPDSLQVLKRISETGKPVIISTGYGFSHRHLFFGRATYLDCIPKYPTEMKDFNLLPRRINGYSNHIPSIYPCIAAVCRGAKIIETHVMLDPNRRSREKTPDSCCSITVSKLRKLVEIIKGLEGCL